MARFFSKLKSYLCSAHLTFYTLPYLMLLTIIGTVAQAQMGLYEATKIFFTNWLIWLGPVPIPGGMTAFLVFTINLLARFLFKSEWVWPKIGIHITHLGILILLFGGAVSHFNAKEGYMVLGEGATSNIIYAYENGDLNIIPPSEEGQGMQWGEPKMTLPFSITLKDFVRQDYPGTNTPSDYYSDINVRIDESDFPVRVSLNKPFRYQDFHFYQASFIDLGAHQATIFQVKKSRFDLIPYIASVLIFIGLALHIMIITRQKKGMS